MDRESGEVKKRHYNKHFGEFRKPEEKDEPAELQKKKITPGDRASIIMAGEKPRHYKGIHLDEWRDIVARCADRRNQDELNKKLEETGGEPTVLTELLFRDWTPHFGYPEHLTDIDDNGAFALCGAVLEQAADEITLYEMTKLNGGYRCMKPQCGNKVGSKEMAFLEDISKGAQRWLSSQDAELYLMGVPADVIVRKAKSIAWERLLLHYKNCKKCQKLVEIEHLMTMIDADSKDYLMEYLDLSEDELTDWVMDSTLEKRVKIFLALRRRETDG